MFSLMGNCVSWMKRRREGNRKLTLAILGLDNAGKTVTTKGFQGEGPENVAPTIGFSSADFKVNKFDITLFDLGGGRKIRGIWKNYFAEIYGIVYVIDSSDPDRIDEAKQVLWDILEHPRIRGKPLLVLANKQDKEGALDELDICERLNLENMVNHFKSPCRVETCSALMGFGKKQDKSIKQGLTWLLSTVSNSWTELDERVTKDMAEQREKEEREKKERMERVRKIREERERQAEKERELNGEVAKASDDEDDLIMGDPFKRIDVNELARKEAKAKEKKMNKKNLMKYDENLADNMRWDLHTAKARPRRHSEGDNENEPTELFTSRSHRSFPRSPRPISDNDDEMRLTLGSLKSTNPLDRSPLPSRHHLHDDLSQDRYLRKKTFDTESGELSLTPRPRLAPLPLPRISGGKSNRAYSDEGDDDEEPTTKMQPRFGRKPLSNHFTIEEEADSDAVMSRHSTKLNRRQLQSDEDDSDVVLPKPSPRFSKRTPRADSPPAYGSLSARFTPNSAMLNEEDDVMIGAPPKKVLQPLDGGEMELESEKRKKKKKRLKKRVAPAPAAENESSVNSQDEAYPSARSHGSASNRLTETRVYSTPLEPISNGLSSSNSHSFSQKWGLLDELPELPDIGTSRSLGPNTDYDQDIIT